MAKSIKNVKVSKAQKVVRHLAAIKAHLTRNVVALKSAKKAEDRRDYQAAIKRLRASLPASARNAA